MMAMSVFKPKTGSKACALLAGPLLVLASQNAAAIGLRDIYALALDNDATYLAATAENRAAQELVPQAKARFLPNVGADATISGVRRDIFDTPNVTASEHDGFFSGSMSLSITQPIYRKDLLVQITQADTQTQQSNARFAGALHDLIFRVADRYFAVLGAVDSLEFANAEREAIEQQLTQSQQRFEVGLIAVTDVEEARAGRDLAVARVIAAETELDGTYEALREVTGRYLRALDPLGDSMTLVVPEPNNIDAWTETALEQNRELEATRLEVTRLRDDIRRVEAGHLPTVDIVGSSGYSWSSGPDSGNTKTLDTSVGLRLSLPLYQGGLVLSKTRQSQHLHQQALENHERQRRATQRLARDSFRGVLSGISRVNALQQAVRSAESALEAIEAGFQVGTRTSVDVLNAQRELFSARRDFSSARYAYILNVLRLKQAAGTLAPEDLAEIDAWLRRV